jgi:uncharacterized protein
MRLLFVAVIGYFLVCVPSAFPQENSINLQNRTIEVVATETVKVQPDIAEVNLGCVTYGETHDLAYQSNLKIADQVMKAILAAGVSKQQIESSTVELGEGSSSDERAVSKDRRFEAHETWQLRLRASAAQHVIDVAVQAGANGIEDVTWDVSDADVLEAKARTAAMKKARATAVEIAQADGNKVGQLLYASNTVNGILGLLAGRTLQTTTASIGNGKGLATPTFSLKLFPSTVEKQATVRAIFALE